MIYKTGLDVYTTYPKKFGDAISQNTSLISSKMLVSSLYAEDAVTEHTTQTTLF